MNEFLLNDTPVKVWAKTVDPHAWKEIDNLSRLPFIYHHLAFMPDVHGGMGMPIGGVLASKKVVVPNAVGVDIGCGMCAVKTNLMADDISKDIIRKKIMAGIRARIPLGMDHHYDNDVIVHRKGAVRARDCDIAVRLLENLLFFEIS